MQRNTHMSSTFRTNQSFMPKRDIIIRSMTYRKQSVPDNFPDIKNAQKSNQLEPVQLTQQQHQSLKQIDEDQIPHLNKNLKYIIHRTNDSKQNKLQFVKSTQGFYTNINKGNIQPSNTFSQGYRSFNSYSQTKDFSNTMKSDASTKYPDSLLQESSMNTCRPSEHRFQQKGTYFFENFMHEEDVPVVDYHVDVLKEDAIKKDYRFHMTKDLTPFENENSKQTTLNGFHHNFPLIMTHIEEAKYHREVFKEECVQLHQSIKDSRKKHEVYLKEVEELAKVECEKIIKQIREDFVKHQSCQFEVNKEITKLVVQKQKIEKDIDKQLDRIKKEETRLFGCECFDLDTEDTSLKMTSYFNLRPEHIGLMEHKALYH